MLDDLYNKDVLRLAATISRAERLADPDGSARLKSPLCGSDIVVDVRVENGKVADFGQRIRACALGQAAASVLARDVIGADLAELVRLRDRMERFITGDGPPPGGHWSRLAALAHVRDHPARHGAVMLPFRATVQAVEAALAKSDAA